MEHGTDPFAPVGSYVRVEEPVDLGEVPVALRGYRRIGRWVTVNKGKGWHLFHAAVHFQEASGSKRVRTVGIFVEDGETWAVDSQGGDQFKVAVHATPVTGKWRTPQLCDGRLGHSVYNCTSYPHAEAVLTCVDHCDAGTCVVVVFDGWDEAERLVGMTRTQGDLANPNRTTV